jgi:hypothetical protein
MLLGFSFLFCFGCSLFCASAVFVLIESAWDWPKIGIRFCGAALLLAATFPHRLGGRCHIVALQSVRWLLSVIFLPAPGFGIGRICLFRFNVHAFACLLCAGAPAGGEGEAAAERDPGQPVPGPDIQPMDFDDDERALERNEDQVRDGRYVFNHAVKEHVLSR